MSEVTGLARELSNDDPAVGLNAVASLRALLESIERLHVNRARDLGWSWAEIAEALGVSKQAVHQKHGPRR
jgi:DNA-directed RNA polymerase specialized sigma24 family protein